MKYREHHRLQAACVIARLIVTLTTTLCVHTKAPEPYIWTLSNSLQSTQPRKKQATMSTKLAPNAFDEEIKLFNAMYLLPTLSSPGIPFVGDANQSSRQKTMMRLRQFKDILLEELDEVEEIIRKVEVGEAQEEVLTDLADWLGDIQVYCASEMRKFGLDNSVILSIIMASNRSKLGRDGKPLYDERSKVMKGPDFFPPEPEIRRYIAAAIRQAARAKQAD